MASSQVRGYVARCEAAATWRASLAGRLDDLASLRTAQLLRDEATWATAQPQDAAALLAELGARGLDFSEAWSDARDYTFTTYCLEADETRAAWLERVLDTER